MSKFNDDNFTLLVFIVALFYYGRLGFDLRLFRLKVDGISVRFFIYNMTGFSISIFIVDRIVAKTPQVACKIDVTNCFLDNI
jgi:hypothetical protein